MLQQFCQALEEAEKHIQTHLDSNFTFDLATMDDRGAFSSSTPRSTPAKLNKDSGKKSAGKGKGSRKTPKKAASSSKDNSPCKISVPANTEKDLSSVTKEPVSSGKKNNKKRKLSEVNQNFGDGAEGAPDKKAKLDDEEVTPNTKAKLKPDANKKAKLDDEEISPNTKAKLKPDANKKAEFGSDDGSDAPASKKPKLDGDDQHLDMMEKVTTLDSTKLADSFQATDPGEGSTAAKEWKEEANPSQQAKKDEANSIHGGEEGQVSVAGSGSPLEDIPGESASVPLLTNIPAAVNIPPQSFSSPIIPATTPASSSRKYRLSSSDESLNLDSEGESDEDWPCLDLSVNENIKSKLDLVFVLTLKFFLTPFHAVHQLQPKDVVWVKYQNYPFWPAIVRSLSLPVSIFFSFHISSFLHLLFFHPSIIHTLPFSPPIPSPPHPLSPVPSPLLHSIRRSQRSKLLKRRKVQQLPTFSSLDMRSLARELDQPLQCWLG